MTPLLVTINEAANALSLGRTSIYALIKEGKLEAVKLGRRTAVKVSSLQQLVEGSQNAD